MMLSSINNDIKAKMKRLIEYIKDVIGLEIEIQPLTRAVTDKLPMYLAEGYQWHKIVLAGRPCILAQMKEANAFGVAQMEKHFDQVKKTTQLPVIAIFDKLEAYMRKRLIEKRIAFIVPDKQLYVPGFLIDLREYGIADKKKKSVLTPVAQQLFLMYILDKENIHQLESLTFKELANLLGTNPMGVTRAVENLKFHALIEVTGDKEKFIRFMSGRQHLWHNAVQQNILINPVLKRVYVDEKPQGIFMLHSYNSALPEYSDINPTRQEFYAIEKNMFYALQKSNALRNANKYEGEYCLEVWKYNPETIVNQLFSNTRVVDPLSLYLCFKEIQDERIEMAMEQIIEKFIW
jgi:DNA-binding transcriptional regulator YhcF (GntR family)